MEFIIIVVISLSMMISAIISIFLGGAEIGKHFNIDDIENFKEISKKSKKEEK